LSEYQSNLMKLTRPYSAGLRLKELEPVNAKQSRIGLFGEKMEGNWTDGEAGTDRGSRAEAVVVVVW
jgi:hypothetical protein